MNVKFLMFALLIIINYPTTRTDLACTYKDFYSQEYRIIGYGYLYIIHCPRKTIGHKHNPVTRNRQTFQIYRPKLEGLKEVDV